MTVDASDARDIDADAAADDKDDDDDDDAEDDDDDDAAAVDAATDAANARSFVGLPLLARASSAG